MDREDSVVASRDQDARPQPVIDVAAILQAAADLITPPGAWTQDVWARDMFGADANEYEDPRPSPDGVCFCLWGAIRQFWPPGLQMPYVDLLQVGVPSVTWNDEPGRTQEEVVERLRAAIEVVRQKASHPAGEPREDAQRRATPNLPLGDA